jgi:putative DNA primase/helicase
MTTFNPAVMPPKSNTGSLEKTLTDAGFGTILEQPRFVLFKKEHRDGKITKIPKQVNGSNAGSTVPETWSTFNDVYSAYVNGGSAFDGIGIILGDYFDTKIVGVDLDHVCDAFSAEWTNEEARMAVADIKTYGERSISGTGVHFLFLNQDVPEGFKTRSSQTAPFDLEVYESGRYFTLSGDWFNGQKIATDEVSLVGLCKTYLPTRVEKKAAVPMTKRESSFFGLPTDLTPVDVSDALGFDDRFKALYTGCRPFGNESADDLALLDCLVKYLGRDADKVYSAFVTSPHFESKDDYHKQKCTGRDDYLRTSIDRAIDNFFTGYSYDDVGNSDMFVDAYAHELVFCKEWDSWAYWNGENWEKKASLRAQELAKDLSDTFRAKVKEYRTSTAQRNPELLKAMTRHSQKMRESKSISAMVRLASSRAVVSAEAFDANPMILNCKNGIVDLRTGALSQHEAGAFCTNIAGAEYDASKDCPKWKQFIEKVLPGEGAEYLQMCVGMAAVGKVYEEAMIFMIGNGSNGKSTIANILSAVFGSYALTLQPDIITATKDGKTPPDFAEVRGKRIVFLSETEEGDRLSTKALKRLSSNETIAARRLYSMPETFSPTHTVFYSTNHTPRIGSGDYGTWRRIKNLPFEYRFTESEKRTNFAEEVLAEESTGIFGWVCEGARKFIENGCKLTTPSFVLAATEEYKANEDIIGQFVTERCVLDEDSRGHVTRVGAQDLFTCYKEYCKENQCYCKPISDFNNTMITVEGVSRVNVGGKKYWTGIRIKSATEQITAPSRVGGW